MLEQQRLLHEEVDMVEWQEELQVAVALLLLLPPENLQVQKKPRCFVILKPMLHREIAT
jgi:hypothetical protein